MNIGLVALVDIDFQGAKTRVAHQGSFLACHSKCPPKPYYNTFATPLTSASTTPSKLSAIAEYMDLPGKFVRFCGAYVPILSRLEPQNHQSTCVEGPNFINTFFYVTEIDLRSCANKPKLTVRLMTGLDYPDRG